MDDKTENLRDIFRSVADEDFLTEGQSVDRGTLLGESDAPEERLDAVLEAIDEKFGLETPLSRSERRRLFELFYAGASDADLADELGYDEQTIFSARMELHLCRPDEPSVPDEAVRQIQQQSDREPADLATAMEVSAEAVERTRAILEARARSRRVSHRYRSTFDEIFTDETPSSRLTAGAREDGLEGATEDAETDVEF